MIARAVCRVASAGGRRLRLATAAAVACTSLACASGGTRPAAGAAPADRLLRVLVFNIHAGTDAAGAANLDRVADLIRSTAADLVLVQEVDRGTTRSGGIDQPQVIAAATNLRFAFGRSLDYQGGQYGIATFGRDGFTSEMTRPLPVRPPQERAGGSYEPRAALVVGARTPIGTVTALNTHLDASRQESYRLQELVTVIGLLADARRARWPVIAAGDFNAEPGSDVYKGMIAAGFRDAWTECGSGDGLTFPAAEPVKRIDYLFLDGPVRCAGARVIETTISDHRPLLVTIRPAGGI